MGWDRRARLGAIVAAALAVVLVASGVGWAVLGPEGGRSPEDTVRDFFAARQAGDCRALSALVTEASRSADGRWGRAEFLDECARVVDDGPVDGELGEVEVVAEHDDRVEVNLAVRLDDGLHVPDQEEGLVVDSPRHGDDRAYARGELRQEHGEWKVVADQAFLRLGRSPEDTYAAYLAAYEEGDCLALRDHLTEDAWSEQGSRSADQFLADCQAALGPGLDLSRVGGVPRPGHFEISADDEPVTAAAEVGPVPYPGESVTMAMDGLTWRLTADPLSLQNWWHRQPLLDEPLPGFDELELEGLVVAGQESSYLFDRYEGDDGIDRRRDAGFEHGTVARYRHQEVRGDYVNLLLYRFADAEGATEYGLHLANRITIAPHSPVVPTPPATVPFAMVTICTRPCATASEVVALGVADRYLVAVEVVDYDGESPAAADLLAQAQQVVQAQLDQLG